MIIKLRQVKLFFDVMVPFLIGGVHLLKSPGVGSRCPTSKWGWEGGANSVYVRESNCNRTRISELKVRRLRVGRTFADAFLNLSS